MIHNILSEKDYQRFLLERLEKDNGYVIRKTTNFDRSFAMDREMLFQFLNDTQPDTMDYLRKIYKGDLEEIHRKLYQCRNYQSPWQPD